MYSIINIRELNNITFPIIEIFWIEMILVFTFNIKPYKNILLDNSK